MRKGVGGYQDVPEQITQKRRGRGDTRTDNTEEDGKGVRGYQDFGVLHN